MKLRFWTNDEARHRAKGDARTSAYADGFTPRHCAGEMGGGFCLAHDHPGEPAMLLFVTGPGVSRVG